MASAMKYLLRTSDGKEYGPTDQDTLIKWAQAGRVTNQCQIRNALMNHWHEVDKFPFLKEYVVQEEAGKKAGKFDKPKSTGLPTSLTKSGSFKCIPSHAGLRGIAWLIDHVILGALWCAMFAGSTVLIDQAIAGLPGELIWMAFTLSFFFIYVLYFAFSMGLKAQTAGQWFAGIMIVREGGEPVLMGRALIWTIGYMLFGATTVVFATVMPGQRAIQDLLSRTRVIRITVRELA